MRFRHKPNILDLFDYFLFRQGLIALRDGNGSLFSRRSFSRLGLGFVGLVRLCRSYRFLLKRGSISAQSKPRAQRGRVKPCKEHGKVCVVMCFSEGPEYCGLFVKLGI